MAYNCGEKSCLASTDKRLHRPHLQSRADGLVNTGGHHSMDWLASDSAIAPPAAAEARGVGVPRHTCCHNYLRRDKVNCAAARGALSRRSGRAGVCTGAAVPGLQECHSADSVLREITRAVNALVMQSFTQSQQSLAQPLLFIYH